jgi:L-alanine-DL-glutamate epimerase-like enolase superfamily enzyme
MTGENRYIFDRTNEMEIRIQTLHYNLKFKNPFRISHGERHSTDCVFVSISYGAFTGYGEATLPPYLGISQQMVEEFIQKVSTEMLMADSPRQLHVMLNTITPACYPAMAAVDMAWNDLMAQKNHLPLFKWLGLSEQYSAVGMFTIGVSNESELEGKLAEADVMPVIKIKTTGGNEKEIIKRIRKFTHKPLAIDANQSWEITGLKLDLLKWLNDEGVILVEQPFKKDAVFPPGIFNDSPVPFIADESFQTMDDLDRISGCYHGINIKLMKCGGIFPALQIIEEARKRNLKIMVGCMSESSCGCLAAAQLISHTDWYDLDGPLLINNDPFDGLRYKNGKIIFSGSHGTGAKPNRFFCPAESKG